MMPRLIDADRLNVYKVWAEIRTDNDAIIHRGKTRMVFADDIANAPTVDIDSLIAEHEDIGYEKGRRDGYAEAVTDVERHGYWIENDTTYSEVTRQTCTCSVCGRHSPRPLGDFCRWCGAKMDAPTQKSVGNALEALGERRDDETD